MARFGQYAPEFRIEINGNRLPGQLESAISTVQLEDGLEGANSVEIVFLNQELQFIDHVLLETENELTLSIGYAPDPAQTVFSGEITGVEPAFPPGGMPTVRVTAHDQIQRIAQGTKDRSFEISIPSLQNTPLPDQVVASILSSESQFVPGIDPVGGALSAIVALATYIVAPRLAQMGIRRQKGDTDYDFLANIARENGWEVFIDHAAEPRGSVLRFKSMFEDFASSKSFDYGSTLMDFTPRMTTTGDVDGVASRIWIDSVKTEFVIVVSWDFDGGGFDLRVLPEFDGDVANLLGGPRGTLSIKPVGFPQTVRQILSELLPRLNQRTTGSGTVIGAPDIRAGSIMNLQQLGSAFSGLYRVTSATHSLDGSGYKTNFEARKEVWFPDI
ncbi:MAG: hypothetical protein AAFV88_04030 [Planctomycetota bacterium]